MKSPLNQRRDEIRAWFDTCDPTETQVRDALKRAARMIWERQTFAEQDAAQTIEHNGRGYNGRDAEFGSRIIHWNGTLTDKLAFGARKMLRKYARQLAEIALEREAIQRKVRDSRILRKNCSCKGDS